MYSSQFDFVTSGYRYDSNELYFKLKIIPIGNKLSVIKILYNSLRVNFYPNDQVTEKTRNGCQCDALRDAVDSEYKIL